MAVLEGPGATACVKDPMWKTTLPEGTAVLPIGDTLAVRVHVEPAVRVPAGVIDKAVVVGMALIASVSVLEVLGANSCEP